MIVEDSNTVKPLKPEKISTHKRKGLFVTSIIEGVNHSVHVTGCEPR